MDDSILPPNVSTVEVILDFLRLCKLKNQRMGRFRAPKIASPGLEKELDVLRDKPPAAHGDFS
jgi:hypothetical protein